MKNSIWLVGAVVLSVGCDAGKSSSSGSAASPAAASAAKLPAASTTTNEVTLQLKNLAELQQLVASKKGKIVVVDAWSTYCEPCMKEFPGLVAMHKKYGPDKVACISLCANYAGIGKVDEEIAEPLKFLKAQGATFDNILSTDADTTLYEKLKFASVPTIFVYDRDGKLAKTFDGEPKYADVEAFVATMVK